MVRRMLPVALALGLLTAANPAALEERGCASCHDSASPDRLEKALAAFDLDQPGWPRKLTERQVAFFRKRLEGKGATPAEVAKVEAFLERERAARE